MSDIAQLIVLIWIGCALVGGIATYAAINFNSRIERLESPQYTADDFVNGELCAA